jgi:hypothetical protein
MAEKQIMRSMRWSLALAVVAVVMVGGMTVRAASKKPYPVPNMLRHGWQLQFVWHKPKQIFAATGHGVHRRLRKYWILRYTVINNTHRDIFFIPTFVLVTDTGKVLKPVAGLSPRILKRIRQVTGDPFIISPGLIVGRLLQGADNAKDGVAVFAKVPSNARRYTFFISGLSGDTAVQKDPLTNKNIVLHKTLVLNFWNPGEASRISPNPQFAGKKWVMR